MYILDLTLGVVKIRPYTRGYVQNVFTVLKLFGIQGSIPRY